MALETSPQAPAPVRQIAQAVAGWIDRLGIVWVEGQVAQVNRRAGVGKVFLTLRDSVADISVPVTCPRAVFDALETPPTEGASIVVQAKPSYYANRGSFSLEAREIRLVGLGELLARLERRLAEPAADCLAALRARDALRDRPIRWVDGEGVGAGIDDAGALLVRLPDGTVRTLDAGEVHLRSAPY